MNLLHSIQSFRHKQVLIMGDVMLDKYLFGKVTRISPEAPVPVLEWGTEETRLGGAANVALNLNSLGALPILVGVVGDDLDGRNLASALISVGISPDGLVLSHQRRTTVKTRVIAGNQHIVRIDSEDTGPLEGEEASAFLRQIQNLLETSKIDVIVLQDYNKGVLPTPIIRYLLAEAEKRGIATAVDPKSKNFWEYKGATLFKPNLKEVSDALGFVVNPDPSSLKQASNMLRERLSNQITLITLSEKGVFVDDGHFSAIVPTTPRNVADVCGAGDTVVSIAALGLACQVPAEGIARLSNLAGGQVVEKVGVAPVDFQQLQREILAQYPDYRTGPSS